MRVERVEHIVSPVDTYDFRRVIDDMPEAALDGFLGEICAEQMRGFARAYAWPALVTVAGTLISREQSGLRSNLYTALVGEVGSGKSSAIEWALRCLGLNPDSNDPPVLRLKAGSGEGLLKAIGDVGGSPRLYAVDELSHLLEKASLERSSFPQILNGLFYGSRQDLRIARGEAVEFNCALSVIGGLLDEHFGDLFGKASTGGLYDRFLFGQCPTGASYSWRPFNGRTYELRPEAVGSDPGVWEVRNEWVKTLPGVTGRIAEIALRAASICAAFDGRAKLLASDLGPAKALAEYQAKIRTLLRPNPGENFEARAAFKILNYLERHAPGGQWILKRRILRDTRAYDLSPSVCNRAIETLAFNGDIEHRLDGRKAFLRLLPDELSAPGSVRECVQEKDC